MSKRAKELLGIDDDTNVSNEEIDGISNENLDSDDVVEIDEVDPLEEMYELDETEIDPVDDLDVIEEAMEALEEAKTNLESLESLVETSLTTGGLTKDTVPYVQFAIESASGDYLSSTEVKIPSIESFNEEDSRMQNTAYVLEGIKDKFKEYYEKTAKFLSNWKEAVEKFWKENKNAIVRQRKHLKNLITVIKADEARYNSMENVSDKNIEVSSKVAEHLSLDGKLSESEIIGGLKELVKIIESLKSGTALGNKLISLSEQVMKDEFVDIKSFSIKDAADLIKKESSILKYKEEYIENDTGIQLTSQTLIGNKTVFVEVTGFEYNEYSIDNPTNTIEHTIPTSVDVYLYWDEKFNKNNKTLPVLSGKDILNFAEEALKFLDYIENDKADWKSGLDISDKYSKANLSLSHKIDNIKISNKKLASKILAANAQTAMALIEPRRSLNKHALSVIQSLYVYLLESAKAHKHETSLSKEDIKNIIEDSTNQNTGIEDMTIKTTDVELSQEEIEYFDGLSLESISDIKDKFLNWTFNKWLSFIEKNTNIDHWTIHGIAISAAQGDITPEEAEKLIEKAGGGKVAAKQVKDALKKIVGKVAGAAAVSAAAILAYKLYKKGKARKAKEEEISKEDIEDTKELEDFLTTLSIEELEELNLDCIATEEYEAQLEVSVEGINWSSFKEAAGKFFNKDVLAAIKLGDTNLVIDVLKEKGAPIETVDKVIGLVKAHKKALLVAAGAAVLATGGHKLAKHLKAKKAEKEATKDESANEALVEILSDYSLEELTDLFDVMIGNEEIGTSLEAATSEQIKAGAKFWEDKQIKGVKGSVVKSITEAFAKGGEHAKKAYKWIKDHSIDSEGAGKLAKWGTELSKTKKGLAAAGIAAAGAGLMYKAHKDAKAKKEAEAEAKAKEESESSTEE